MALISILGLRRAVLAAVLVSGALAATGALAQSSDVRSLAEDMRRLQRDVDDLRVLLNRRGAAPAGPTGPGAPLAGGAPAASADFVGQTYDRFSNIEQQLRDLTGRVEEINHRVSQVTTRLDKLVGDVDFRLNALERGQPGSGGGAAPAAAAPPGPQAAAPAPQTAAVTIPAGSPEAQYEFAYGQLLQAQREQGDFSRAEAALKAFVQANPNHRLAGNAQYWLGETYYVRRDYQNAATAFAEGFRKYPNSEKAPDNLLKLGMALGQLNRKSDACGTLGELERRYPQASTSIKQATQREKQRLGCS